MYISLRVSVSIRNDIILITHCNNSYTDEHIMYFLIVGLLLMLQQQGLCFALHFREVVCMAVP